MVIVSLGEVKLTDEERKKLKKEIAEELGVDEEKIVLVMTLSEYIDELYERLKEMGVPENILYYVNFTAMIHDMKLSGEIDVVKVKLKDQYGIERTVEIVVEVEW